MHQERRPAGEPLFARGAMLRQAGRGPGGGARPRQGLARRGCDFRRKVQQACPWRTLRVAQEGVEARGGVLVAIDAAPAGMSGQQRAECCQGLGQPVPLGVPRRSREAQRSAKLGDGLRDTSRIADPQGGEDRPTVRIARKGREGRRVARGDGGDGPGERKIARADPQATGLDLQGHQSELHRPPLGHEPLVEGRDVAGLAPGDVVECLPPERLAQGSRVEHPHEVHVCGRVEGRAADDGA